MRTLWTQRDDDLLKWLVSQDPSSPRGRGYWQRIASAWVRYMAPDNPARSPDSLRKRHRVLMQKEVKETPVAAETATQPSLPLSDSDSPSAARGTERTSQAPQMDDAEYRARLIRAFERIADATEAIAREWAAPGGVA